MSENTNQAELSPQEKRSSLLSHLLALRKVVVISAIALVAAFGVNLFIWLSDLLLRAVSVPFLSAVAASASLYRRLMPFLSGRVGLGDVVFDLSLVGLLLFLCVRVLEVRRWRGGL